MYKFDEIVMYSSAITVDYMPLHYIALHHPRLYYDNLKYNTIYENLLSRIRLY